MLLVVDIGNSNIHLGLWNGAAWQITWRAQTVADRMPDEYAVLVRNFLASANLGFDAIDGVAIGSVVPRLTSTFVELSRQYIEIDPLVVSHQTRNGVGIAIDQPEQAGADRIINAAAVVTLYSLPAIVIDFGTATTFDVITSDKAYRGGAIAPGITIAHDALVSHTAQLRKIDLVPPPSPIGTNTVHAMQAGIFLGYVALIEGMVARTKAAMAAQYGEDPLAIRVIGTGGLAPIFQQNTPAIDLIAPELTLEGLRIIYSLNATG